jgi:DNA-binding response OmpR family regulator
LKILVIDDEPAIRSILSRLLSDQGYQVTTAEDGVRGWALFLEQKPDLVITDIIMPEREGVETIRKIRREYPHAKIIAISGGGRLVNYDVLAVARKFGADEVIHKPFDARGLLEAVVRVAAADGPEPARP